MDEDEVLGDGQSLALLLLEAEADSTEKPSFDFGASRIGRYMLPLPVPCKLYVNIVGVSIFAELLMESKGILFAAIGETPVEVGPPISSVVAVVVRIPDGSL